MGNYIANKKNEKKKKYKNQQVEEKPAIPSNEEVYNKVCKFVLKQRNF